MPAAMQQRSPLHRHGAMRPMGVEGCGEGTTGSMGEGGQAYKEMARGCRRRSAETGRHLHDGGGGCHRRYTAGVSEIVRLGTRNAQQGHGWQWRGGGRKPQRHGNGERIPTCYPRFFGGPRAAIKGMLPPYLPRWGASVAGNMVRQAGGGKHLNAQPPSPLRGQSRDRAWARD